MSRTAPEKPRCCLLISSLAGGGAEGVCVSVASGLADQGIATQLVVLTLQNAVFDKRLSAAVDLVNLDITKARNAFVPLIRQLNKAKPETLIAFNYELAVILVLIRPFLRFKHRLIARNINTLSSIAAVAQRSVSQRVLDFLVQRLYGTVDHIVNQCVAMQADLVSVIKSAAGKSSVIYNPVNPVIEQRAAETSPKANCPPYILCVGRLEAQKDFALAISAFAHFAKDNPTYQLKIIGTGSLESALRALACSLNIQDKVIFEGFSADPVPFYTAATFTLLSSSYEGFPNVLVESITLGIPVVAVNCPSGPDEIIMPQVNGILVQERSAESLAAAMQNAATFSWNANAIKTSATRFSHHRILQQWLELL